MLARALGGEARVPFLRANGSSFDQTFVGLGAVCAQAVCARP
jgi:ATP-dependent Zn protease